MTKTRQWAIFTTVAALVVLVAGWLLLISPQRSTAKTLNNDAANAQQQAQQLHTQLASLLAQKRNLPEQQRILAQIATQIPSDPAEPTLIRQLQGAAHTAGVDMSELDPSAPTAVAATATTPSTTTSSSTPAASSLPLYQVPVAITVNGSYFNVELFEHSLEQLPRALLVNSMTVTSAGGSSPGASSGGGTPGSGTTSAPVNGDVTAQINATVFLSPKDTTSASTTPSATSGSGSAATGSSTS